MHGKQNIKNPKVLSKIIIFFGEVQHSTAYRKICWRWGIRWVL